MKPYQVFSRSILASAILASGVATATELEEIIVTAQKRDQNAMTVPMSVTVVNQELMSSIFDGGADVRALSSRVPGLYVESSNGRVAPRFYIRGFGNSDFDLAASQPVSIVMDDVVMENVILKSFPLFDMDSTEVLRGPQGTLFGRNTTAGIVKFNSVKPSQESSGYMQVSAGEYNTFNTEAAVGGAITDTVSARGSFLYTSREDWIDNGYLGRSDQMGGYGDLAGRIQVLWEPDAITSMLFSLQSRDLDGTAAMFRANIFDQGSNELNDNYDRDTVYYDDTARNPQKYQSTGFTFKAVTELYGVEMTAVSSYQVADGSSYGDIDGGNLDGVNSGFVPFPSTTQDSLRDLEQISSEIRFADSYGELLWQTGFYVFSSEFDVETNPFFKPATTVSHTSSLMAVFGQLEYPLSDQLNAVVGLRYTDDSKTINIPKQATIDYGQYDNIDDQKWSGDFSLNYSVSDDMMVYARYANGFRGPSIQGRDAAFSGTYSTADSETVNSYEIGIKAELHERIRINASTYYYTVDDMQFTAVGGEENNIRLLNADKGEVVGFELDTSFIITDNLTLNAGFAYNDTEIQDDDLTVAVCAACTVLDPMEGGFANVDGNPFPNSPETTANLSLSYNQPLANGDAVFFFTDVAYQGDTSIMLYDSVEFKTDDQFEVGLKAGYRSKDDWEASIFGRNITDEDNVQGAVDFNNLTGFVNDPSIWGVQLRASF